MTGVRTRRDRGPGVLPVAAGPTRPFAGREVVILACVHRVAPGLAMLPCEPGRVRMGRVAGRAQAD